MMFFRSLAVLASTLALVSAKPHHTSELDQFSFLTSSGSDGKCKQGKRYPFNFFAGEGKNVSKPITLYDGKLWISPEEARPTTFWIEKGSNKDEWGVLTVNPAGRELWWSYLDFNDNITVGPKEGRQPYSIKIGEKDGKKWPRIAIYKEGEDRCLSFQRQGALHMPRFSDCGDIQLVPAKPYEWESSEDGCEDLDEVFHSGL